MKQIEFETSLGIVRGKITSETKVYDDYGEKFIVDIDESTADRLDMFQWKSVFIYNERFCKIELVDNKYGYPEYKYTRLRLGDYVLEEMESAWAGCGDCLMEFKTN